jgi:hypothetical protein
MLKIRADDMEIETRMVLDGDGNNTIRYFTKTDDGFDGTAQGWGYKTKEKLMKAYWFHQNRHKINGLKSDAKKFLTENPKIKKILSKYFDFDNVFHALKCGTSLSFETLMNDLNDNDWNLENKTEIIEILNKNKHLWKTIERGL